MCHGLGEDLQPRFQVQDVQISINLCPEVCRVGASDVPRSESVSIDSDALMPLDLERGNLKLNASVKSPKSTFARAISNHICAGNSSIDFTNLCLKSSTAHLYPMSANSNRLATRSKNAAQHPGHVVTQAKQTRRTSEEVAAERKAKEDAKRAKEEAKKANIKRVADFEQDQAKQDAMEQTPRVVTKPKPLVRTRSYADVLRCNDVDMTDGTAEPGSPFELATVEAGQTTDDAMETAVQDSPPRKKDVCFFLFFSTIC